jgi:hypothetical protein
MSKSQKSTQTDHLLVFCVDGPHSKENQSQFQQPTHSSFFKITKKTTDVEDVIIDKIASEHSVYAKGAERNTALKNPLKWKPRFSCLGTRLLISFQSDIDRLRGLLALSDDRGSFVDRFEKTLCDVVRTHHRFLNQFSKYVHQPGRSVMHGLAVFVLFFSRIFKSKFVAFAMEFLLVALHQIYLTDGESNSTVIKSLIELLENCDRLTLKAEEQFLRLLGNSKELRVKPGLLLRLFLDYLVANDFLVPAD